MGWKNVKKHYNIVHLVRVTCEGICIGSAYIHDIIIVGADGCIKKRYDNGRSSEELHRYQKEMETDPAKLRELVLTPDTFSPGAVTVYTYDGCNIIEKLCEEPGWPNVTHDGAMMYENTFSTDKSEVVAWAKRSADCSIKSWHERLADLAQQKANVCGYLVAAESDRAKLEQDYPSE